VKLTPELHMLPKLKYHTSGPKIVLRHHFQGDPWIHFCNSYRVYLFLKFMNKVLLKMIAELLQLEAFLFRMTGFFFVSLRRNAGYGFLTQEVSRSHTTTHHSR